TRRRRRAGEENRRRDRGRLPRQPVMAESSPATWVLYASIAASLVVLTLLATVFLKSRPSRNGDVFVASRMTRGNRIFPTQVGIGPSSVVRYQPQWFGREEESIH